VKEFVYYSFDIAKQQSLFRDKKRRQIENVYQNEMKQDDGNSIPSSLIPKGEISR
jgi:hypothetical protein